MAIIYSYPSATPTSNDLLLGTDVDAQGKPTKNYTIKSIIDLIASGATGLGAVLSINNSAKNSNGVNQPINDLTFIKGTLSATFASFLTIGGASINGTIGTGFTSISSTGATGFTGNLLGVINGGSSLAGTSGPGSTDAENVLGVTQVFTDSSTRIATTAFVQSVATVADLDFRGDAAGVIGSVDLDLQTLDIVGTALNIETSTTAGGQVLTLKLTDDVTIADDLTVTDVLTVSGTGASSTIAGGLQVNNSGGAHAFRVKGQTNDNLIATNYGATDAEDQVAIGKNVADNGTRLDVSGLTQSTTITSTNLLTAGNVKNEGYYEDSNSSSGSNGQVLTSSNVGAGPKTLWVDDPNPTPYEWIVASDFDTGTPPTANTPYTVANGDAIDFVGVGNIQTEWDLTSQEVRISAVGDSVTGTGVANQVTYWTGAQTINGDAGMTYDATANNLTVAAVIKAGTFTTTAGASAWTTTVLNGFTSITSISTISSPNTLAGFIGDAGASLVPTTNPATTINNVQFQGNASTANSLKLSGTVSMSGDTVAAGVTYTHGGPVPLVSTISDSVVYNKTLAGFNATTGAVQNGDSIIEALERLQGQITTLPQGLVYQGVWSAAGTGGGTPDLTDTAYQVNGHFYICDTAGTAAPNGAATTPNDWDVRDWVIFADDGAGGGVDEWQKIDNSSLAGGTGTPNTMTKWLTNQTIGNSNITDAASTVTIADTVDFITQGNNTFGNTSADASTFLGNVTLSENLILEKGLSLGSTSTVPYGTAGDVLTSGGGVDIANSWTTPTVGTLTGITAGAGITTALNADGNNVTVNIDYVGTDNAILSATQTTAGAAIPSSAEIMFNDPSNAVANTVLYAPISSLPFVPALSSAVQNTIPVFATTTTLGDSIISQNAGATEATVTGILDVTSYIEVGPGNMRILTGDDSIFISSRTTVPGSNDVQNTALGNAALNSLTNTVGANGNDNTAVGYKALEDLTTGYNNTALGSGAGKQLTTAHSCIAIGQGALDVATGNNNSHSIAIGSNALGSLNDPSSNAGIYNVAIGSGAALNKSSGKKNVFIGGNAAYNKASGDENVYIGSDVAPGATVESGATTIGYGINSNGSNTITLGHGSATVFYGGQNGIDIGSTAKPWGDMHGNYGYFTRVGIGTAPQAELDILTSARIMRFSGDSLTVLNTNSTSGYFNIYSTNVTVQNGTLSAQKLLSLYDNTAGSVDINVNLSSTDSGSVTKYSGISFIRANETLRLGAKTSVASPVTAATAFIVQNTGKIQGGAYGSGTNTGTPTYNLEVDSSGNVIETPSTNPGGNGGTFSGSKDIDAGGVIKVFTLTRATTGCLVFDVFFTADFVSGVGGGPPIAEKWTVVHGISQTPVYNKIISNDGQFGTGGYDVTFADASSGTAVECSVAQRSGSSYPSLSYTIIVGYSENNALTFTPA